MESKLKWPHACSGHLDVPESFRGLSLKVAFCSLEMAPRHMNIMLKSLSQKGCMSSHSGGHGFCATIFFSTIDMRLVLLVLEAEL